MREILFEGLIELSEVLGTPTTLAETHAVPCHIKPIDEFFCFWTTMMGRTRDKADLILRGVTFQAKPQLQFICHYNLVFVWRTIP